MSDDGVIIDTKTGIEIQDDDLLVDETNIISKVMDKFSYIWNSSV